MANSDRVRLLGLIQQDAVENWPPERWPFTLPLADLRSLTRAAVYAIPVALLERIDGDLPNWLSPAELAQERRFAELCAGRNSVGVFLGDFVGHDLLLCDPMPSSAELFRLLDGEKRFDNRAQLENSVRSANERLQPLNERLEAYLGWLITDPQFRQELTALRRKWEADLVRIGRIPQIPVEQELERWRQTSELDQRDQQLVSKFSAFYERWQLRGLATWDLPIPQGANLGLPTNCSHLFVDANRPAIALAATLRLPVGDAHADLLETSAPAHLSEWRLIQNQQHPNHMRYSRLANAFKLYVLDTLTLRSAYPEKLRGKVAAIDRLLGKHLEAGGEDSIKKLRQWIDRRCAATRDRPGGRRPR
jgi:hypothetical protein